MLPDISTSVEFSVDMTCTNCESKVSKSLSSAGFNNFKIDLGGQKVIVETPRNVEEVKGAIESCGKIAVLVGSGHLGAAVAMLGAGGDPASSQVRGVVRLTQLDRDR